MILNKKIILLLTTLAFALFLCSTATATVVNNTITDNIKVETPAKTITTGRPETYTAENPAVDGTIFVYQKVGYDDTGVMVSSYIYYKNLTTGGRVSTYSGSSMQINPKVSGTLVVWQDYREANKPVIYWKNIATGNGGRVSYYNGTNLSQQNPDISGYRIVWQDFREGKCTIYWKDIANGSGGRVSTYTGTILRQEHPAISGNRVVWEDYREGATKPVIYWKDIQGSGGRVSTYTGPNLKQVNPAISGTRVVWEDYREGISTPVIYWRDINSIISTPWTSGRVSSYTGYNLKQGSPAISNTSVVWMDFREGSWVIYWKDIQGSGGRVSTYNETNLAQWFPAISGTRVVWTDYREGELNPAIYWKDLKSTASDIRVAG